MFQVIQIREWISEINENVVATKALHSRLLSSPRPDEGNYKIVFLFFGNGFGIRILGVPVLVSTPEKSQDAPPWTHFRRRCITGIGRTSWAPNVCTMIRSGIFFFRVNCTLYGKFLCYWNSTYKFKTQKCQNATKRSMEWCPYVVADVWIPQASFSLNRMFHFNQTLKFSINYQFLTWMSYNK